MDCSETQSSLRRAIERSLNHGTFDPADVLPRLARLARVAEVASDDHVFANQKLAELLVERDPWRAALYVRRALKHRPGDDRAWAILAFCQTLLGNFRCALNAYRKALVCAPSNPWYAHNLGHLLDVALGEPERAIEWLRIAYEAKGGTHTEIAFSYVHALARAGKMDAARAVLSEARSRGGESSSSRELDALVRWLDQGAPSRRRKSAPTTSKNKAEETTGSADIAANNNSAGGEAKPPVRALRVRSSSSATPRRLVRVLERGMSHLPLDTRQRERALALAHDACSGQKKEQEMAELAAAVAYAIVYIDHVPLSQAEVAAPFRVGVAHLRGRFAELRAKLDIIRGDARYSS
jgi:tetratricopeptide (TPR) repeat protein